MESVVLSYYFLKIMGHPNIMPRSDLRDVGDGGAFQLRDRNVTEVGVGSLKNWLK